MASSSPNRDKLLCVFLTATIAAGCGQGAPTGPAEGTGPGGGPISYAVGSVSIQTWILADPPGMDNVWASGINSSGVIVGHAGLLTTPAVDSAYLWSSPAARPFTIMPRPYYPFDIDDTGVLAGTENGNEFFLRRVAGGALVTLSGTACSYYCVHIDPRLSRTGRFVVAANDLGLYRWNANDPDHPLLVDALVNSGNQNAAVNRHGTVAYNHWSLALVFEASPGSNLTTTLATLPGASWTAVSDLNDHGMLVGTIILPQGSVAVIWFGASLKPKTIPGPPASFGLRVSNDSTVAGDGWIWRPGWTEVMPLPIPDGLHGCRTQDASGAMILGTCYAANSVRRNVVWVVRR